MIDLHCHILPGLDDGAEDWEQSLGMAQIAEMDGISGIVCTPHCSHAFPENTRNRVISCIEQFRAKLRQSEIRLELYPGAELALSSNLHAKIQSAELLTINDSRKIALIEMPPQVVPPNIDKFFWMMQSHGINVVLAHPERNHILMLDPSALLEWVQSGVLVQITSASLIGHFGSEIRNFSRQLLRNRMVHFVASDSHGIAARKPVLSRARAIAQSLIGPEQTHRIFYEYPLSVVNGEIPEVAPPIPVERKPSLIRRFFSLGG